MKDSKKIDLLIGEDITRKIYRTPDLSWKPHNLTANSNIILVSLKNALVIRDLEKWEVGKLPYWQE